MEVNTTARGPRRPPMCHQCDKRQGTKTDRHGRWTCWKCARRPARPITKKTRPGRNDPCVCGSGRKYKRCCLKNSTAVDLVAPIEAEGGGE